MLKINRVIKNGKILNIVTSLKMLLISIAVIIPNIVNHTYTHLVAEIIEIAIIFLISQLPIKFYKFPAYIVSSLLYLIIIAQEWVRLFSGTFTTKTMLENINNIHALGPSLPKYVFLAIIAILITFLPMRFGLLKKSWSLITGSIIGVLLALTAIIIFKPNTAIKASYALIEDYQKDYAIEHAMESEDRIKVLKTFEKNKIDSGINKKLDNMNVIIIFAEGTSRKVLEDTQYSNLMPAVYQFANESIDVRNYYNHTAPTYRGIRGF